MERARLLSRGNIVDSRNFSRRSEQVLCHPYVPPAATPQDDQQTPRAKAPGQNHVKSAAIHRHCCFIFAIRIPYICNRRYPVVQGQI